jgi:hypothetical protein
MIHSPPPFIRHKRNRSDNNNIDKSNGLNHPPIHNINTSNQNPWQIASHRRNSTNGSKSGNKSMNNYQRKKSASNKNSKTNRQRKKRNVTENNYLLPSPANRSPPKGPTPSLWITLLQPNDNNVNTAPTAEFIEGIFGPIGTIHSLRFGRGDYCFINFVETKVAKQVMLELNGKYIENFGIITLKWAHPPSNHPEAKKVEEQQRKNRENTRQKDVKVVRNNILFFGDHEDAMPTCSLWVAIQSSKDGSFADAPDVYEMTELFKDFGRVFSMRTGTNGYSFVNFMNTEDATKVYSFYNGRKWGRGSIVRLRWAMPPPEHPLYKEIKKKRAEYEASVSRFPSWTPPRQSNKDGALLSPSVKNFFNIVRNDNTKNIGEQDHEAGVKWTKLSPGPDTRKHNVLLVNPNVDALKVKEMNENINKIISSPSSSERKPIDKTMQIKKESRTKKAQRLADMLKKDQEKTFVDLTSSNQDDNKINDENSSTIHSGNVVEGQGEIVVKDQEEEISIEDNHGIRNIMLDNMAETNGLISSRSKREEEAKVLSLVTASKNVLVEEIKDSSKSVVEKSDEKGNTTLGEVEKKENVLENADKKDHENISNVKQNLKVHMQDEDDIHHRYETKKGGDDALGGIEIQEQKAYSHPTEENRPKEIEELKQNTVEKIEKVVKDEGQDPGNLVTTANDKNGEKNNNNKKDQNMVNNNDNNSSLKKNTLKGNMYDAERFHNLIKENLSKDIENEKHHTVQEMEKSVKGKDQDLDNLETVSGKKNADNNTAKDDRNTTGNDNGNPSDDVVDADSLRVLPVNALEKSAFNGNNVPLQVEPAMLGVNRGYKIDNAPAFVPQMTRPVRRKYNPYQPQHKVGFNIHMNSYQQPIYHEISQPQVSSHFQQYYHHQRQQQQKYYENQHAQTHYHQTNSTRPPAASPQKISVMEVSSNKNGDDGDGQVGGINCETIRIMLDGMTTLYKAAAH